MLPASPGANRFTISTEDVQKLDRRNAGDSRSPGSRSTRIGSPFPSPTSRAPAGHRPRIQQGDRARRRSLPTRRESVNDMNDIVGFRLLEVGQRVKVKGASVEGSTFRATKVGIKPAKDQDVIEGAIQRVDPEPPRMIRARGPRQRSSIVPGSDHSRPTGFGLSEPVTAWMSPARAALRRGRGRAALRPRGACARRTP